MGTKTKKDVNLQMHMKTVDMKKNNVPRQESDQNIKGIWEVKSTVWSDRSAPECGPITG